MVAELSDSAAAHPRFTVTLMNPLACGHDGSWHLDLIMEASPGVVGPPSASRSTRSRPAPEHLDNVSHGGGDGGGDTTAAGAEGPSPAHVDDVSDDGSGSSQGEAEEKIDEGEWEVTDDDDGAEISDDEDIGVTDGDEGGAEKEKSAAVGGDRSLGPDNAGQNGGEESNSKVSGKGARETQDAAADMHAAGTEAEDVSSDDVSSEDELISTSGKGAKPNAMALSTPAKSSEAPPNPEGGSPPLSNLPKAIPSPGSPASSARASLGTFRSPDSFASFNTESIDEGASDSSFDESEGDTGVSSGEEMEGDSDEYEVDVPYPPCSIMHKKRKTFKDSLCEECYTRYKCDLEEAGADISDIDSETGRRRRQKPATRRRRQREGGGATPDSDERVSKRSRKLRRARSGSTSSREGRKKRRTLAAAVPAPAQRSEPHPVKLAMNGGQGKGPARATRRLRTEDGEPVLQESSSDAGGLSESSGGGGSSGGNDDGESKGGAPRQPQGKATKKAGKPPPVKPPTGSDKGNEAVHSTTAPSPVETAALGKQKRASGKGRAVEPPTQSRGPALFSSLVTGDGTARMSDSLTGTPAPRPKLKKNFSVDSLPGRAVGAAGAPAFGNPHLKRAESLETAGAPRASSLAVGRAPGAGTSSARGARPPSLLSANPRVVLAEVAPKGRLDKRRMELSGREGKESKKCKIRGAKGSLGATSKAGYERVPHFAFIFRKVSNGKYFRFENDRPYDGTEYGSAEACASARELDRQKESRGNQKGSARNLGDVQVPSHVETADLIALARGAAGGSRIGKKITSAYKKLGASTSTPKAKKSTPFFAQGHASKQPPREQPPREQPPREQPREQPRPPAPEPLPSPPIVHSYSKGSDIARGKEAGGDGLSKVAGGGRQNGDSSRDQLGDSRMAKIRFSERKEGRPKDGLHVPSPRNVLPQRSGSKGGRAGRPAPDTRSLCDQTGNSSMFATHETEESLVQLEAEMGAASPSDESATTRRAPPPALSERAVGLPGRAGRALVPATSTVGVPNALPALHVGPISLVTKAKLRVTQALPPSAPRVSSTTQGMATTGAQRLSPSSTPPGPITKASSVVAGCAEQDMALTGSGTLGEDALTDVRGAAPNVVAGPLQDVGEATRDAASTPPSVPLRHHVALVRHNTAPAWHALSPCQHPGEDRAGNGDEEQGRELLQSMMLTGRATEPEGNGVVVSNEVAEEDAPVERPDPSVGVLEEKVAAQNAGRSSTSGSAFVKGNLDKVGEKETQEVVAVTAEDEYEVAEAEGWDDEDDAETSTDFVVADIEQFLKAYRSQQTSQPVADDPPALAATEETPNGDGSAFLPPPLPPSNESSAGGDAENDGGGGEAAVATAAIISPQVAWSRPKLACHGSIRVTQEPALPKKATWATPRRIGGGSDNGRAAASPRTSAHDDPGSSADDMPVPHDKSISPTEAVQQVTWRTPSRVVPPTSGKPGVAPDGSVARGLETQAGDIPREVLKLPSRVTELFGENPPDTPACSDLTGEKIRVAWRQPGRLGPASLRQPIVPPSSSRGPVECPPEDNDAEGKTEDALPPFGSAKRSPDERDDIAVDQFELLLQRSRREYSARGQGEAVVATEKMRENGNAAQGNGHPKSEGKDRRQRDGERSVEGSRGADANGHPHSTGDVNTQRAVGAGGGDRTGKSDLGNTRRNSRSREPAASSRSRVRSRSPVSKSREGSSSSSTGGQRRERTGRGSRESDCRHRYTGSERSLSRRASPDSSRSSSRSNSLRREGAKGERRGDVDRDRRDSRERKERRESERDRWEDGRGWDSRSYSRPRGAGLDRSDRRSR